MAEENQDGQEKTEEPSQRKIDKHKEDGKVLTSKEMFVFTGIAGALLVMYAFSFSFKALLFEWGDLFVLSGNDKLDDLPATKSFTALFFILKISLLVGIPMLIIVLATQFAVGGINFAPKALSFKSNRINPLSGIKRMFSLKSLVELGKALLKVGLLFASAIGVIYYLLPRILRITDGTLKTGLELTQSSFPLLIGALLISLLLIAALDYFYQRYEHIKSLRMTKQEVKDEYKDIEGRPEVKAQIRRKQREMAEQRMMEQVKEADVVITNPEHFSVALIYDPESDGAPVVVAKGLDHVALRIRNEAKEHGVVQVEIAPLARALYFTTDIDSTIPEELYYAVAQVIAYVFSLASIRRDGQTAGKPDPEIPPNFRFDAEGNPE